MATLDRRSKRGMIVAAAVVILLMPVLLFDRVAPPAWKQVWYGTLADTKAWLGIDMTPDRGAATDDSTAARMRSQGWHCPGPTSLERTAILADGSKVYRLACGRGGPYYDVTVHLDGSQSVRAVY